jgi:NIMA (never in mitosis gene a)-related kinase
VVKALKGPIAGNEFIAKKIIQTQLEPKEQEQSLLEADLLRNLIHPNIVEYKASFIDKGMLIIVMEYCEMRDLAYHIKLRKAKN